MEAAPTESVGSASQPRAVNFNPGPSALPLSVLEETKRDLLSWHGCGLSVLEMSHRSPEFSTIACELESDIRSLLEVPDSYAVLFFQGGATAQFAAVPLNLAASSNSPVDYIVTGGWSAKAAKEASQFLDDVRVIVDTSSSGYTTLPENTSPMAGSRREARYMYYCANETVHGVQFPYVPKPASPDTIVVGDFSSCFMAGPLDVTAHGVVIAGAQKNIGPAGVTVVLVRRDLLNPTAAPRNTPTVLNWYKFAQKQSMLNTPPCFAFYVTGLVLKWLIAQGGLQAASERSQRKAKAVYDAIDSSDGFYVAPVEVGARSLMNVRAVIHGKRGAQSPELEAAFVSSAASSCAERNMVGLAGHRDLGGLRASLYNAVSENDCALLVKFMAKFQMEHASDPDI